MAELIKDNLVSKAPANKPLNTVGKWEQVIADMDKKLEGMDAAGLYGIPYIDVEHEAAQIAQHILEVLERRTDVWELLRYTNWEPVQALTDTGARYMSHVSKMAWKLRPDLRKKVLDAYSAWKGEHAIIYLDRNNSAVISEREAVKRFAKRMVVADVTNSIVPRPLELRAVTREVKAMRKDIWRYAFEKPLFKLRASVRHSEACRAWEQVPREWHRVATQCYSFFIDEDVERIPVIPYIKAHRNAYPLNALYLVQMVLGKETLVAERDIDRLRARAKRARVVSARSR